MRIWGDEDATSGGSEEHFFRVNVVPYWELSGNRLSKDSDCQSVPARTAAQITDDDCILTQFGNTAKLRFHNVILAQYNVYVDVNGSRVVTEPDDAALGAAFDLDLQDGDNVVRVRLAEKGGNHAAESYGSDAFYYKVFASESLVSNWDVSGGKGRVGRYPAWQEFTTGDNSNGYSVRLVRMRVLGSTTSYRFNAAIRERDGNSPGSFVFPLSAPPVISGSFNLHAPPNAKLEPDTRYYLWVNSEDDIGLLGVSSNSEDSTSQPGWSIANQHFVRGGLTTQNSLLMRLRGWALPDSPNVTNVESIAAPTTGSGYRTGSVIKIRVTYSEAVEVTGTPTLLLDVGNSSVIAQYQATESTDTQLVFAHTVASGELDRDGIEVQEDSLTGTIKRKNSPVNADLLHNRLFTSGAERVNSGPIIDRIRITSEPVASRYGPSEGINITVTFDDSVTVTGDPEFAFSLGNSGNTRTVRAEYNAQLSSGADVVFTYTVLPTDEDGNGISIGDDALRLDSDDSIQDPGNMDAILTHSRLGSQDDHKIDPRPRVASVEVTSTPTAATDTYGAGEIIEFTVTFNQPVFVTGDPHFVFSLGNSGDTRNVDAAYDPGRSGGTSLVFTYTVVSTDVDNNGISILESSTSFVLETGETVRNRYGNNAVTTYSGQGAQSDHKVDGSQTPSNTPPEGLPTISGTAEVGQTLTASTSGISDADGLTSPGWTYQWIRVEPEGMESDIPSATGQNYTLVSADRAHQFRVRVTFTDDGSTTETLRSSVYPTTLAPTAPESLTLTTSRGDITLEWTPPEATGSSPITKSLS